MRVVGSVEVPMLTNSMPRYEPLSDEALATIHAGWKRLGQEVGVQFDNEEALQLFRDAGQTVDDDGTVRFDADFLLTQAAKAPAEFEMIARNRERDLVVGGDHMTFCAVQGPPFVRIGDERREGTYADYENLLRLVQMDPNLDTPGRNVLEPNDLPLDSRHLLRALSSIRLTDRVWAGEPSMRTSRPGTVATSSAHSTRSSASATASGGRRLPRQRTTTAGSRTAAWTMLVALGCAGARSWRRTSSRRSTSPRRTSCSTSSAGASRKMVTSSRHSHDPGHRRPWHVCDRPHGSHLTKRGDPATLRADSGASPSGKAAGFGPATAGSNPAAPALRCIWPVLGSADLERTASCASHR